jgi:hypothetical protein
MVLKAGTQGEIDAAFASLAQLQAGGLIVDPRYVLVKPARANCGAGITPCCSLDLWAPPNRCGRRPDQLWN